MKLRIWPCLLSLPVIALTMPAPAYAQPADDTDLLNVTCGEYLVAARVSDPGPKPSKARQAQALGAQDDMADAMLWVHGYLTGRAPAGTPFTPLTRAWMVEYVGKLARVCIDNSPDGKMRLADAAAKL